MLACIGWPMMIPYMDMDAHRATVFLEPHTMLKRKGDRLIVRRAALVLLTVVALIAPPRIVYSQAHETVPLLTVIGSGAATAHPDTVDVQAGVVSEAHTAREALSANTTAMQALHKTMTAFTIAERDIQTVAFNVSPVYEQEERDGQPPRIVAYRVENQVRLTLRDLGRLGELLDALVSQGANTVHGIQFRVGDRTPVLDQARRAAVDDAQHKATLYAKAAGVALGRIFALREEQAPLPSPMPMADRMRTAEAAVPIAPGELTFTVRVVVTYELVGQ